MNTSKYLQQSANALREHGLWLTAILTVIAFFGLFLVGEADAVVVALLRIDLSVVLVVAALVTVSYGIRFLRWAFYLRELGIEIPLRTSLLVFFSGFMLAVTPGKVGEVWKAWFLRDLESVPVSRTISVIGAERVTDVFALAAFAALGVLLYRRSVLVVLGVVVAFLVGLGVLQWRLLCLAVLARCRNLPIVGDYAVQLRTFYEGAYALFRPRPLTVATGISLVAWGLEGLALWVILEGLGVSAGPLVGLFVFGLGSIVGAVSMLPGGLAAAEASMVGALVALGYASSLAAAATLLIRVGTLWYGVGLGTVVFGVHRLRAHIRVSTTKRSQKQDDPSMLSNTSVHRIGGVRSWRWVGYGGLLVLALFGYNWFATVGYPRVGLGVSGWAFLVSMIFIAFDLRAALTGE
jgi:uncharacterized protein (TIRG00374 family)